MVYGHSAMERIPWSVAWQSLQGLLRRLKQEPAILEAYECIIKGPANQGDIEAVQWDETKPGVVHYLSHHAVVRLDKTTTKVRVVYGTSARSANGLSLNDCIHKGLKPNQLIFDHLVQFRSYNVAFTADLEKAFLMVSVEEADRKALLPKAPPRDHIA